MVEKAKERHCPLLAADAIAMKEGKDGKEILMITRLKDPQKGTLALPGGHVDYGEDPIVGCVREL